MIRGTFTFILLIFLLEFVTCTCNETQIDINSANITELDRIINVGPKTAEWIIGNRTYNTVEDLTRIYGIGDIKINEIKTQGLACVSEDKEILEENETLVEEIDEEELNELENESQAEEESVSEEEITKIVMNSTEYLSKQQEEQKITRLDQLNLESKDIKSEENKEILKRTLCLWGIITLILGVGLLLLINWSKKKNELV